MHMSSRRRGMLWSCSALLCCALEATASAPCAAGATLSGYDAC